jgi:CheY-like chemotaxis protein
MLTSEESTDNNQHQTLSYKILIAEPSDLFTRVIEEMFSETAFKYLLVNDGQAALMQIEAFNPDVVLLAYDLPTISGLDVTRVIRKQGNKVPVVAYTHQRDKSMINHWIPLGISGYLIKPSKKSSILKSVSKAVKYPIEIIHYNKNADKDDIKWIPE